MLQAHKINEHTATIRQRPKVREKMRAKSFAGEEKTRRVLMRKSTNENSHCYKINYITYNRMKRIHFECQLYVYKK